MLTFPEHRLASAVIINKKRPTFPKSVGTNESFFVSLESFRLDSYANLHIIFLYANFFCIIFSFQFLQPDFVHIHQTLLLSFASCQETLFLTQAMTIPCVPNKQLHSFYYEIGDQ